MKDELPMSVSRSLLEWMTTAYGHDLRRLDPNAPLWLSFTRKSGKTSDMPPALSARSVENICHDRLGVNAHTTRHTWSHIMEQSGAKVSDIQARLGHSSLSTTTRYLSQLRQAENPYADVIAGKFGI